MANDNRTKKWNSYILGSQQLMTARAGECIIDYECPTECTCKDAVVDCRYSCRQENFLIITANPNI